MGRPTGIVGMNGFVNRIGQSTTEYSLCIGLVALLCIGVMAVMGGNVSQLLGGAMGAKTQSLVTLENGFEPGPNTVDLTIPITRKNGQVFELKVSNFPTTVNKNMVVTGADGNDKTMAAFLDRLISTLVEEDVLDPDQVGELRDMANQGHQVEGFINAFSDLLHQANTNSPNDLANQIQGEKLSFLKINDSIDNTQKLYDKFRQKTGIESSNPALAELLGNTLKQMNASSEVGANVMLDTVNTAFDASDSSQEVFKTQFTASLEKELVRENLKQDTSTFCKQGQGSDPTGMQCVKSAGANLAN